MRVRTDEASRWGDRRCCCRRCINHMQGKVFMGLTAPVNGTGIGVAQRCNIHKLCTRPHRMPPPRPLYASCGPPPVHSLHACDAQRALCHEYSLATGSNSLWLWLWCRPYKVCSDVNSQPKRPSDLDLWPFDPESGGRVTCDVGYLCANFSLPRPLCARLSSDVRDRQTSDRQTSDKNIV